MPPESDSAERGLGGGRRRFLTGAGAGLLAFQVGGAEVLLSARDARAQNLPLRALSAQDARVIEALGEALVPGAVAAGLTHYLDQQLAADPANSLLMLRYLDVPPPYRNFYRPSLAALAAAAHAAHQRDIQDLDAATLRGFIESLQKGDPAGWHAPPAPLVYFVLRADAIDVVYGTPEGYAALGLEYLAHIAPPAGWG